MNGLEEEIGTDRGGLGFVYRDGMGWILGWELGWMDGMDGRDGWDGRVIRIAAMVQEGPFRL